MTAQKIRDRILPKGGTCYDQNTTIEKLAGGYGPCAATR